jgi:hypothetical protein
MAKPPARRRWADANGVAKPKLDYCALGRPRLKFLENAPFAQASQPNSNADGNSAMANPSRKAPITPHFVRQSLVSSWRFFDRINLWRTKPLFCHTYFSRSMDYFSVIANDPSHSGGSEAVRNKPMRDSKRAKQVSSSETPISRQAMMRRSASSQF